MTNSDRFDENRTRALRKPSMSLIGPNSVEAGAQRARGLGKTLPYSSSPIPHNIIKTLPCGWGKDWERKGPLGGRRTFWQNVLNVLKDKASQLTSEFQT